jgi:hypothetical protein
MLTPSELAAHLSDDTGRVFDLEHGRHLLFRRDLYPARRKRAEAGDKSSTSTWISA